MKCQRDDNLHEMSNLFSKKTSMYFKMLSADFFTEHAKH